MKLKELLRDIPVLAMTADPETEIKNICYDSRAVEAGDLFVAVEGFKSDGHRFIPAAMERGAAAVLCSRRPETDIPCVLVEDSRRALALVSAAYFGHPARKLKMIGVTGTDGKTTSTMILKHTLEECLETKIGLIGTISNWIGDRELPTERTTPESYELQKLLAQMVEEGCAICIMEVSSHALALDRVAGIEFEAGLFTNLTQDHLDFHETMENYARAKSMLFSMCRRGAINLDDLWSGYMAERASCPLMGYSGKGKAADLTAEDVVLSAGGVSFMARYGEQTALVKLAIPGEFSVENALTVLAACIMLDIPLGKAAEALGKCTGVKGRLEVVAASEDYTVVIDFAHTPDALEKVIKTMKTVCSGRVVVLFGCGGDRDGSKRPIMGRIAAENADFAVVTSDNPRTEEPDAILADIMSGIPESAAVKVIPDRREAIAWVIDNHEPGDVILLAGKGHETYQEIHGVKYPMDERKIVAEYIQRSGRKTL